MPRVNPLPATDGLDPYRVLQVQPDARPEVIEAAFRVLREMACHDERDGVAWLVRLNWAHRALTSRDGVDPPLSALPL